MTEERAGLAAELADRQRDQPDRDLLPGRDDDVDLAVVGVVLDLAGQLEQAVGLARHRRDHHRDLVTGALGRDAALGDGGDALDGADRGAAEFLNDASHDAKIRGVDVKMAPVADASGRTHTVFRGRVATALAVRIAKKCR